MSRHLWILGLALAACSGEDGTDGDTDGPDATTGQADCADPASNPWSGTCVETFLAACFDPAGACEGDIQPMGDTTFTWDNGASVVTTTDLSSPLNPVVLTELTASDGTLCAQSRTETNVGGCFAQTTYMRESDGAQQVWCIQADGSIEVSCDDGSTIAVSAEESQSASECQYGSDAEACETNLPEM